MRRLFQEMIELNGKLYRFFSSLRDRSLYSEYKKYKVVLQQ